MQWLVTGRPIMQWLVTGPSGWSMCESTTLLCPWSHPHAQHIEQNKSLHILLVLYCMYVEQVLVATVTHTLFHWYCTAAAYSSNR
jgi:hypothetical protein